MIAQDKDYKLVYFTLKKGTIMPMHDHPNKVVLFNMFFGKFKYISYDKMEEKYRYNKFTEEEYEELIKNKTVIDAVVKKDLTYTGANQVLMTPSNNNVHEFTAEENTCFLDASWPNYSGEVEKRKSYFVELKHQREIDGKTKL